MSRSVITGHPAGLLVELAGGGASPRRKIAELVAEASTDSPMAPSSDSMVAS